jgi:murein DD-endopeptidase
MKLGPPLQVLDVTSSFGPRVHPVSGQASMHNGTDFRAPIGTPIFAVAAAVVQRVANTAANGLHVVLLLANGWRVFYLHLSSTSVAIGDTVERGQVLGATGDTGNVTGPHLHFEVHDAGGKPLDPMRLFGSGATTWLVLAAATAVLL